MNILSARRRSDSRILDTAASSGAVRSFTAPPETQYLLTTVPTFLLFPRFNILSSRQPRTQASSRRYKRFSSRSVWCRCCFNSVDEARLPEPRFQHLDVIRLPASRTSAAFPSALLHSAEPLLVSNLSPCPGRRSLSSRPRIPASRSHPTASLEHRSTSSQCFLTPSQIPLTSKPDSYPAPACLLSSHCYDVQLQCRRRC